MTANKREIPGISDPLGETLHMLRLNGSLYCRSELRAPWGVDMPVFDGYMMFHVVTSGSCWLDVPGELPVLMRQGSMTLVPHGNGHVIRSADDVTLTPLFDIPVMKVSDRYEVMQFGGEGELTELTCGVVSFDQMVGRQLLSQLPRILHVHTLDEDQDSWLQSTLRFIVREARQLRPGGETVITHLADILIIQAIRTWIDEAPEARQGWLAALRDKQIGKALAAIHRAPERSWTVDSLAREVGMSRSGLSARFSELVGQSVKRYLTHWRMQLARAQLIETTVTLTALAERFGYQSEAAFSRAFRRIFGMPPGQVRHQAHNSERQL